MYQAQPLASWRQMLIKYVFKQVQLWQAMKASGYDMTQTGILGKLSCLG